MALRLSQCVFAAASGFGHSNYSAYAYMNFALGLQVMWSLCLACKDIFALRNKKDLHTPHDLLFFVVIDLALATLMFSAACASASLTIFFMWDVNLCGAYSRLACRPAVRAFGHPGVHDMVVANCIIFLWVLATGFILLVISPAHNRGGIMLIASQEGKSVAM